MLNNIFLHNIIFFHGPNFLYMLYFLHGVNYFEFLCCWYNYSYGPKDKISNLLALIEEMVFRKNVLDKRSKTIPKGKKTKTQVTTESNARSRKKGCQCAFTIKTLYLLPTITYICYYKNRHINAIRGISQGKSYKGTKLHLQHMF